MKTFPKRFFLGCVEPENDRYRWSLRLGLGPKGTDLSTGLEETDVEAHKCVDRAYEEAEHTWVRTAAGYWLRFLGTDAMGIVREDGSWWVRERADDQTWDAVTQSKASGTCPTMGEAKVCAMLSLRGMTWGKNA